MEQERYYLRVGIFMTLVIVSAVMIIGWFATSGHKENYDIYAIYFKGSVNGLGLGSPVRLKGITVGNVKGISFAVQENDAILVTVSILKGAPIRNDTVASMQVQGITGTSFISLDNTGEDPTPKTRKANEEYPVIASKPSSLEKVFSSIPDLVEEMKKLSVRGQALLSDDNIAIITHALKSIDDSARTLQGILGTASGAQTVSSAILELNEALVESKLTLREIRMLARTIREDPSVIIHGVQHEGKQVP